MARWTALAEWRGPTRNSGDGDDKHLESSDLMSSHRGCVVHIAEGYYEGTISWQKNPSAQVSSHFIIDTDGTIAQMVDTDERSWCQQDGNDDWLSLEFCGFTPNKLTDAQLSAGARLLARAHQVYGVPLQVATSPSGKGLGHHSMGATWGHQDCPGPNIIAQKPEIVKRAQAIVDGGDDMYEQKDRDWLYQTKEYVEALYENRQSAQFTLDGVPKDVQNWVGEQLDQILTALTNGATVPGLTADDVRAIVREELDKTKLAGA